jgi:branched-chain amino acid transport system permease protein
MSAGLHTIAKLAIVLFLLLLPLGLGNYGRYMVAVVMIYGLVALSLNILTGIGGQISIGHAGFWALGAYASGLAVVKLGAPFLLAVLFGGIVAGAFGVLVALPALRVQGHYLAIATLGFALFVQQVLFEWDSLTGGREGLFVPRPSLLGIVLKSDFGYDYLLIAIFLLFAWMTGNFACSHTGRSLAALRMSSVAAECCGIVRSRQIILAFAVSAFYTGISGALYGHLLGHLSAETFSLSVSLAFLTMAVIGGLHSRAGALLGAAFLALAPEVLRQFRDLEVIMYGAILVLCVQLLPGGLISIVDAAPSMWKRLHVSA